MKDRIRSVTLAVAMLMMVGAISAMPTDGDAPAPAVMVLLDSSGSMAGGAGDLVRGTSKRQLALDALEALLAGLSENVALGLAAYGHGSSEGCEDVEVLVPLGVARHEQVLQAGRGLLPKGKSPIELALWTSARALEGMTGPRSILLLTDGVDSCSGAPSVAIHQIRQQGADVRVHVVGIDVASGNERPLRAIADAGDGAFHPISDPSGLSAALDRVRGDLLRRGDDDASGSSPVGVAKRCLSSASGWDVVGGAKLLSSDEAGVFRAQDTRGSAVWYWDAPPAYLGDVAWALGGELVFHVKVSHTAKNTNAEPDLLIEGAGRRLTLEFADDPTDEWTPRRIPLTPAAGWRDASGAPVTASTLSTVLGDLESLRIRGEYSKQDGDIGFLAHVQLGFPGSDAPEPEGRERDVENPEAVLEAASLAERLRVIDQEHDDLLADPWLEAARKLHFAPALVASSRLVEADGTVDADAVEDLHWRLHMMLRALDELPEYRPGVKGRGQATKGVDKPRKSRVRSLRKDIVGVLRDAEDSDYLRSIDQVEVTSRTPLAEAVDRFDTMITRVRRNLYEKPLESVTGEGVRITDKLTSTPLADVSAAIAQLDVDGPKARSDLKAAVQALDKRLEAFEAALDELTNQHRYAADRVDRAKALLVALRKEVGKLKAP